MKLLEIKGIGARTAQLMEKLGIRTPEDLVRYYPAGYDDYGDPVRIADLRAGMRTAVTGTVTGQVLTHPAGRVKVTTTVISDAGGSIKLTWFNAPFMSRVVRKGSTYVFRGTVRERSGKLVIDHPEVYAPEKYSSLRNTLVPVYSLTKGLSGKTISKAVKSALEADPSLANEYLPETLMKLHGLMDEAEAVPAIHFPADADEFLRARTRLVFDEFFLFIIALRLMKAGGEEQENAFPMKEGWITEEVIERLPFSLTRAQTRVWREIETDLAGKSPMSRLIQGDVGSGKTVVAFLAMIMAASNGCQSVLMAPTEVLARQHFEKLEKLRAEQKLDVLRPVLLTGSMRAAERKEALKLIGNGQANAIVGTHALIQDAVSYRCLGLVITDEQHRFGVRQRSVLRERGHLPHTLVMSATPIPRTLGAILYADLDISVIDELPASRMPVKTAVVDESFRDRLFCFMQKQLDSGRQCYVICPMIEPSEDFDTYSVTEEAEKFKKALPGFRTEILHGRMKAEEKNDIMNRFLSGEIRVLVSTTVVEVGVDVPNASVIAVLGAERFGLAQLHQLRGRVGRGGHQSYCVLLAGQTPPGTAERLNVLKETTDGFVIAEKDLLLRGPGDLLGIRQSGEAGFRIADITKDGSILRMAGNIAAGVLQDDPALAGDDYRALRDRIDRYISTNEPNFSL